LTLTHFDTLPVDDEVRALGVAEDRALVVGFQGAVGRHLAPEVGEKDVVEIFLLGERIQRGRGRR
jgi:hypothetical protein